MGEGVIIYEAITTRAVVLPTKYNWKKTAYDASGRNGRPLHGQCDAIERYYDQYRVVKPAVAVHSSAHQSYAVHTTMLLIMLSDFLALFTRVQA